MQTKAVQTIRQSEWTKAYRQKHSAANAWAAGYGVINHTPETQSRIFGMAQQLTEQGIIEEEKFFNILYALDRISSAGLWLVVHEVYANKVYLDGRELKPEEFKKKPEGHTGGSLNMIPAYMGYMAANAITQNTRSWIMGQGHCVAAIDSVNLLLNNLNPEQEKRYSITDEGLTNYVQDFYSYKLNQQGRQDSPVGSHVHPHTAGGLAEGGYLGFVQLQYAHMPLPGESLVTFLSDGAFEEQRGSDWIPRWWRAADSGYPLPIMINNGRRIDQRSTMAQKGGTDWFHNHLKLNHFDPIEIDGRDPAAFVWAIWEMESRLKAASKAIEEGKESYPVRIPYAIATAPKGYGFYNAGENLAHNLPLGGKPRENPEMAEIFNEHARQLWVHPNELKEAISRLQNHSQSDRPKEKDHPLMHRNVQLSEIPTPDFQTVSDNRLDYSTWTQTMPMQAVDSQFLATVQANPFLRPRVGNPDEMRSNRMKQTLKALKFRVTDPEDGLPEDLHGCVITALNEEAVASAALANKAGINIIVTYEAFGAKMHGVMRQEIIFTKHRQEIGQKLGWLSIPLILTSHTWENGKNEQSHQDTVMAEAMMNEDSDVSRVLFPPDFNTAAVCMQQVYQTHGQFWTMVVSKRKKIANLFTPEEASRLLEQGAIRLDWASHNPNQSQVILTAIGSYQLEEVLKASTRLREKDIPHSVVYMIEPGRFRFPRNEGELAHAAPASIVESCYPNSVPNRIFLTHTRPEPLLGTLQPLHTGYKNTVALGFVNSGGTLNRYGMLFINRSTWGHVLQEVTRSLEMEKEALLTSEEIAALEGKTSPQGILIPKP